MILILFIWLNTNIYGMAVDCQLAPTGENYIGIRYKAWLAEDELSETQWLLLFGESGFTMNGEYQPHFIDLMIKGSWAAIYDDELCADGSPPVQQTWDNFTIEFGLSDYEDGSIQDNDIGAWTLDPILLPRRYSNIDSQNPTAADKIMVEYQVDEAGTLEGREIEISFVRAEQTYLPQNQNYFMDPDLEGVNLCTPNSQDDILYRRWIATLKVPSLGINSSVDFYINASQADKITQYNTLNFMWENPGRPAIESDKFKVIIFDPEVKTTSGEWKKATKFLVDLRTPDNELPYNDNGELVGGFRKVKYNGSPALEASFGYGYTDYVIDGNPNDYESSNDTKAVIDLGENEVPVELTSFTAELDNESILLKWSTQSETNNYGFEVQRLVNDKWEKIGFARGYGTTTAKHDYKFIDELRSFQKNHTYISYRLKQIDVDGCFKFSQIKSINFELCKYYQLFQNYPNPFNPSTTIKYVVQKTDYIEITIHNVAGKKVRKLFAGLADAGLHKIVWDGKTASGYPVTSGIYIYKIVAGDFVSFRKMILAR